MRRVAWGWAAAAAAFGIGVAGCGDSRTTAAAPGPVSGCASCHSAPGEAPPFRDPDGSTDTTRVSVGAHDAHLHGSLSTSISCADCHTVPRSIADPGHLEDSPGDIQFGTLARTGGASPSYVQPGCAAVYCHGNFAGGNRDNTPRWVGPAGQAACGTCHGLPPPTGRHAEHVGKEFQGSPVTCASCHGPLLSATHVNGVKNVALAAFDPQLRTCATACHGPRLWTQ